MTHPLTALALCCLAVAPAAAADATFDSNGVKIRYVAVGKGEAVVLIHGWMADAGMWNLDAGSARRDTKGAEGFQFIALDCRGHGKSDKSHDAAKYDAEVAADVVRLLDHLKIDKAHLVGFSSGAFVAGKVAATYPGRVRSVVYVNQTPVVGEPKAADFSEVELFAKAVEKKDLASYIVAVTPATRRKPTTLEATAAAWVMFGGKDTKALVAAGRGFKKLAVSEKELKGYKGPVLFVLGGDESAYMTKRVTAAHKLLGGELKVIPGGDHITTLAKPEFLKTLFSFLRTGKADGDMR